MRSLTFFFLLLLSAQNVLGAVGFFAFGVDFEQSGIEFKQKVAEFRMAIRADGLASHFVKKSDFVYRTSAFHVSHGAKTRIPAMLAELRNSLCFLDPFFIPIRESHLSGPSHMRNETLLSFEYLLDTLTRYGMMPFEEEQTEYRREEDRSPNMIIAANIPMNESSPALATGKLITEVKLNQYVTVYNCENDWFEMDCEAVKSDYIMTPCKN